MPERSGSTAWPRLRVVCDPTGAIAVQPDFEYAVVEHDGANFILANDLLASVTKKFGWTDYRVVKLFKGSAFEHLRYRHAFLAREGVFVLGDYVTLEQGTGLVHTAPGHGADDFAARIQGDGARGRRASAQRT